jgi:hypothetical protein
LALFAVAARCTLLEGVNASGTRLTDASLNYLSHHSRALKTLVVANCPNITDTGLTAVMQGCLKLVELRADGCQNVCESVLSVMKVRYGPPQLDQDDEGDEEDGVEEGVGEEGQVGDGDQEDTVEEGGRGFGRGRRHFAAVR